LKDLIELYINKMIKLKKKIIKK